MYHPLGLQLRDAVVDKKTSYLSPGRVPIRFGLALLRHGFGYSRLASNSLGSSLELLVFLPLLPERWDDKPTVHATVPGSCGAGDGTQGPMCAK